MRGKNNIHWICHFGQVAEHKENRHSYGIDPISAPRWFAASWDLSEPSIRYEGGRRLFAATSYARRRLEAPTQTGEYCRCSFLVIFPGGCCGEWLWLEIIVNDEEHKGISKTQIFSTCLRDDTR